MGKQHVWRVPVEIWEKIDRVITAQYKLAADGTPSQQTHYALMTLLRQNDIILTQLSKMTSFWRYNDVIIVITSCVQWGFCRMPRHTSATQASRARHGTTQATCCRRQQSIYHKLYNKRTLWVIPRRCLFFQWLFKFLILQHMELYTAKIFLPIELFLNRLWIV